MKIHTLRTVQKTNFNLNLSLRQISISCGKLKRKQFRVFEQKLLVSVVHLALIFSLYSFIRLTISNERNN